MLWILDLPTVWRPQLWHRRCQFLRQMALQLVKTNLTANGTKLANVAEKTLNVITHELQGHSMTHQMVDVTRPLNSISRICDNQNFVVSHRDGGWVENEWTGQLFLMRMDQGPCASVLRGRERDTEFLVSLLEHHEWKEMGSRVSVEDSSCAVSLVWHR